MQIMYGCVPSGGFEPPTLAGYASEAYAYASSATRALRLRSGQALFPGSLCFNVPVCYSGKSL